MDEIVDRPPAASDVTTIDNEHQVQIGLLDAFSKMINEDAPGSQIDEMFNQLASYSEVHFMSEQLLMRMYAYPDYDDHVQDHETMIEHLDRIKQNFMSGNNDKALEAANEMRNFLLGHINSRDQAFSDYLNNMQPA